MPSGSKNSGWSGIQVVGIKFGYSAGAGQQKKAREWKAAIGRPVVLFMSSREGRRGPFLEALQKGKGALQGNLLFVVPRHLSDLLVRQLFLNSGLPIQSRSELAALRMNCT